MTNTKKVKQPRIAWQSRKVWKFDHLFAFLPVAGPLTVTEVITGSGGPLLVANDGSETHWIAEEDAYLTKKAAFTAHYKFNAKRIRRRHKELDRNMLSLKKYYLRGLHG